MALIFGKLRNITFQRHLDSPSLPEFSAPSRSPTNARYIFGTIDRSRYPLPARYALSVHSQDKLTKNDSDCFPQIHHDMIPSIKSPTQNIMLQNGMSSHEGAARRPGSRRIHQKHNRPRSCVRVEGPHALLEVRPGNVLKRPRIVHSSCRSRAAIRFAWSSKGWPVRRRAPTGLPVNDSSHMYPLTTTKIAGRI